jgi:hypothetical protein
MPTPLATTLHLVIRSSVVDNVNHHLWNNNGSWWCHFTLQSPAGSAIRIRRSLKTADLEKARARRDRILQALSQASGRVAA